MGEYKLDSLIVETISCYKCGTVFAMAAELHARRQKDGGLFWCPNGHDQCYRDTELDKTKRMLENVQKRLEWAQEGERNANKRAETTERRRRSVAGHATRLRKRIANGQCPCCKQRFAELEQHIAEKHPRYKPKDE